MEPERIALSQQERDRLKVLHEMEQGHLTQVEAARRLKVTDRQVRRFLLRVRQQGDRAVVHGLRGRSSNRKLAARLEQRVLARVRQRYADFGPTLAAEHLAQDGLPVSRETLRKWMTQAALWCPRPKRLKAVHVWRERRACFGELVMLDSSPFRWLEERGPTCQLIALIDDATSRIWGRFAEQLLLATFNLLPVPPLDGNTGVTLLMGEKSALKFLDWTQNSGFGFLGLLLAWVLFGKIFGTLFALALNVLYPGARYG